jgi:hypothetical protein
MRVAMSRNANHAPLKFKTGGGVYFIEARAAHGGPNALRILTFAATATGQLFI